MTDGTLRTLLKKINDGKVSVLYLSRNSFRVFVANDDSVCDVTDWINILRKVEIKQGQSVKDLEGIFSKYKEVQKITMGGGGYDKAGSALGSIARKLLKLKEFKRVKVKDSIAKRGCDASYHRL